MSSSAPNSENERNSAGKMIEASFSTLAISLGTQAIVAMGLVESPITGKFEKDMDAARFNVDLLRMLRDKSKGNLSQHEEKLLTDMIYDLQMKYVQAGKASQNSQPGQGDQTNQPDRAKK